MFNVYTFKKKFKILEEEKTQEIFLSRRTRKVQNLMKIDIAIVVSHFNL